MDTKADSVASRTAPANKPTPTPRNFAAVAHAQSVIVADMREYEAGPDNVAIVVLAANAKNGGAFVKFTISGEEWARLTTDDVARQFGAPALASLRHRLAD